jgi:hypothetical protein
MVPLHQPFDERSVSEAEVEEGAGEHTNDYATMGVKTADMNM